MQNQFGNPDQAEIQAYLAQVMGGAQDPEAVRQRQEAEEAARQQRMVAGLGQAASTVGAAIGGVQAPDQSFYQGLSQQADQGLANFDKQQAAESSKRMMLAQHLSDRFDRKEDISRQERLAGETRKFQETQKDEDRKLREKMASDAREHQEKIAAINAGAKSEKLNPFDQAKARKFGDAAVSWTTQDRDTFVKNMQNVDKTIEILEQGGMTGPIRGRTPDFIRGFTNQDALVARDAMQSAIQDTLRPTLGAQFTEKEGERIMNLAFNEKLSDEENLRRSKLLKEYIQRKIDMTDALYTHIAENNGSDAGFNYDKYGMRSSYAKAKSEDGKILSGSAYADDSSGGVRFRRVKAPNGVVRSIPETDVAAAVKAGGELVD